jgi:hypothetical protein
MATILRTGLALLAFLASGPGMAGTDRAESSPSAGQTTQAPLASGPVLLSGDTWHFTEQMARHGVPPFNTDRAQSLASMDRLEPLARNLHARLVIQHEPGDIAKLPAFPEAAR